MTRHRRVVPALGVLGVGRGGALNSYRAAGLTLASEIELSGLWPCDAGRPVDVTIELGAAPDELPDAGVGGPTWQTAGERFLLSVPGVARYLLTAGSRITVQPDAAAAEADVAAFLTGTVFGILMHQRGRIVLHASAVRVGDRAVLFCGPSGAGKSTLATTLAERGWPVLSDDICAIDIDGAGQAVASSDGRRVRLWEQAISRLDLAERRGLPVRPTLQKFYLEPRARTEAVLPVGAVYALRSARPTLDLGLQPLNLVDAALTIRRNAYRPRLVATLDQREAYFRAAAAIAERAGVFFCTREMNFNLLPTTACELEAHWGDLDLIERAA